MPTLSEEAAPETPRRRALHSPRGRFSVRMEVRVLVVGAVLTALILVLGGYSVIAGEPGLGFGDVLRSMAGTSDRITGFIVVTLRLPRVLTAILVGAALGASGAVFQSISRNPLGSPDIIGFTSGATTGAVVQITILGGGILAISLSSVVGGVAAALAVYLLAFQRGVQGYRLVLVGIGVSALLQSVNSYLLTRADLSEAQGATLWMVGSLNGRGWEHVVPLGVSLAVVAPVVLLLGRQLAVLEMGDEAAKAFGMAVERVRFVLVLAGAALCAVATAAAGPVAFVALAAPQLARRLTHTTGVGLVTAGLMGSLLLVVSDLAARRLFGAAQLPVGVVTGAIGGLYLAWLLWSEWRSGRG